MASFRYFEDVLKNTDGGLIETIEALQLSDKQKQIIEAYKKEADLFRQHISLSAYEFLYSRLHGRTSTVMGSMSSTTPSLQQLPKTELVDKVMQALEKPQSNGTLENIKSCLIPGYSVELSFSKESSGKDIKIFRNGEHATSYGMCHDGTARLWQIAHAKIKNIRPMLVTVTLVFASRYEGEGSVYPTGYRINDTSIAAHTQMSVEVTPQSNRESIKFKFLTGAPTDNELLRRVLIAIAYSIVRDDPLELPPFRKTEARYSDWMLSKSNASYVESLLADQSQDRCKVIITRITDLKRRQLLCSRLRCQAVFLRRLPTVDKEAVSFISVSNFHRVNLTRYEFELLCKVNTSTERPWAIEFINNNPKVSKELFINAVCQTVHKLLSETQKKGKTK